MNVTGYPPASQSDRELPPTPLTIIYKPRISRKFPRTKLGCLTCRTRRKKCDQRHPVCQNCEKREVGCSWPPDVISIRDQDTNHLMADDRRQTPHLLAAVVPTNTTTADWHIQWPLPYSPNFLPSPSSRLLFDRYISQTSKELGVTANPQNPFLGYVIPLAFSDELYMNCVLALSGADLTIEEEIDPATKSMAWSHYSAAVRGLHKELSAEPYGDVHRTLHLLFLTLSMVMVEVSDVLASRLDRSS